MRMALSSKVRQLLMGMGAYAQTTKGFDRVAKAVSRKKMKGNTLSGEKYLLLAEFSVRTVSLHDLSLEQLSKTLHFRKILLGQAEKAY